MSAISRHGPPSAKSSKSSLERPASATTRAIATTAAPLEAPKRPQSATVRPTATTAQTSAGHVLDQAEAQKYLRLLAEQQQQLDEISTKKAKLEQFQRELKSLEQQDLDSKGLENQLMHLIAGLAPEHQEDLISTMKTSPRPTQQAGYNDDFEDDVEEEEEEEDDDEGEQEDDDEDDDEEEEDEDDDDEEAEEEQSNEQPEAKNDDDDDEDEDEHGLSAADMQKIAEFENKKQELEILQQKLLALKALEARVLEEQRQQQQLQAEQHFRQQQVKQQQLKVQQQQQQQQQQSPSRSSSSSVSSPSKSGSRLNIPQTSQSNRGSSLPGSLQSSFNSHQTPQSFAASSASQAEIQKAKELMQKKQELVELQQKLAKLQELEEQLAKARTVHESSPSQEQEQQQQQQASVISSSRSLPPRARTPLEQEVIQEEQELEALRSQLAHVQSLRRQAEQDAQQSQRRSSQIASDDIEEVAAQRLLSSQLNALEALKDQHRKLLQERQQLQSLQNSQNKEEKVMQLRSQYDRLTEIQSRLNSLRAMAIEGRAVGSDVDVTSEHDQNVAEIDNEQNTEPQTTKPSSSTAIGSSEAIVMEKLAELEQLKRERDQLTAMKLHLEKLRSEQQQQQQQQEQTTDSESHDGHDSPPNVDNDNQGASDDDDDVDPAELNGLIDEIREHQALQNHLRAQQAKLQQLEDAMNSEKIGHSTGLDVEEGEDTVEEHTTEEEDDEEEEDEVEEEEVASEADDDEMVRRYYEARGAPPADAPRVISPQRPLSNGSQSRLINSQSCPEAPTQASQSSFPNLRPSSNNQVRLSSALRPSSAPNTASLESELQKSRLELQNLQLAVLYSEALPIQERKRFFHEFFKFFRFGSGMDWWPTTEDAQDGSGDDESEDGDDDDNNNDDDVVVDEEQNVNESDDTSSEDFDYQSSEAFSFQPQRVSAPPEASSYNIRPLVFSSKATHPTTASVESVSIRANDGSRAPSVVGQRTVAQSSLGRTVLQANANRVNVAQRQDDNVSISSDASSRHHRQHNGEAKTDINPAFASLAPTIYREVAVFLALNEARPNFLIQLFRELQCLTTDYLRHRSLNFLHDLIRSVLSDATSDTASVSTNRDAHISQQAIQQHLDRLSSTTVSSRSSSRLEVDSVTSEDASSTSGLRAAAYGHTGDTASSSEFSFDLDDDLNELSRKPKPLKSKKTTTTKPNTKAVKKSDSKKGDSQAKDHKYLTSVHSTSGIPAVYDYEEHVTSATSVDTPSSVRSLQSESDIDAPFAKDSLGDTVIHSGNSGLLDVLKQIDSARTKDSAATPQRPSTATMNSQASQVLSQEFHNEIETNKSIVLKVAELLLKESSATSGGVFTERVLSQVSQIVLELTHSNTLNLDVDFQTQLRTAIRDTLVKFVGRSIADQTEAILRDISDILYDEMIFNKVIRQIDQSYTDEIVILQSSHDDLSSEIAELKHQREKDMSKLQKERWQRLRKGNRSSNTNSEAEDSQSAFIPEHLTPAQLSLDSDEDEVDVADDPPTSATIETEATPTPTPTPAPDTAAKPAAEPTEVTLDDLPPKLDVTVVAPTTETEAATAAPTTAPTEVTATALAYLEQQPLEQQLAPDTVPDPSAFSS